MAACACWPPHVLRPTRRRRLHRQPAARLHLRARRPAAVPAAGRRLDGAAREGDARCAAAGDRAVPGHRAASPRPPPTARWPRMARAARPDVACASASPPARPCRPRRASCGRRPPASRSSTASARPRCCTSSSRADEAHARPGATGTAGAGLPRRGGRRRGPRRCRAARSAGSPSRARPAAATSTTRARPTTCRTAGTSPATPTCVDDGRLLPLPGAHRRHDHLRRLQHRRPRGGGARCCCTPRWPSAAWSACRTRSAGRSSRPSSCCGPATRPAPRLVRELQDFVKRPSRPTSTRARSSSAPPCRAPRPASCSASAARAGVRHSRRSCKCCNPKAGRARAATPTASPPSGRQVFVAGQIGWNAAVPLRQRRLRRAGAPGAGQRRRGAGEAGGAQPEHIVRMTWYVTDKREYLARAARDRRGVPRADRHYYPAMTAVQVAALMEDRAKVEIEATAVVPQAQP